ncbi:hypothetical protein LCGC14_0695380 [marine sediment metagenome]|uniref:Bacteriophage Mu GpT domain-containing protein n=1 Tax=marine sediment metagenome TaxID=412755 RepID=A0A0F9R4N2_9ZZZZ
MASTTTDALNDSMDVTLAQARRTREHEPGFQRTVLNVMLVEGSGLNWREALYAQLNAFAVGEDQEFDNPETITDTVITFRPQGMVVQYFLLDEVARRMSKRGFSLLGPLGQEAIERQKDTDGLATLDSFTNDLGAAGTTPQTGHVSAGVSRIMGNTTEPGAGPFHATNHPFPIKDLQDEIVAAVGTGALPEGPTAQVLKGGFATLGPLFLANVHMAGNLAIDSSTDSTGGIYAEGGVVIVQGATPTMVAVRNEKRGLGGSDIIHRDQYVYGIRNQSWGFGWVADATVPTN